MKIVVYRHTYNTKGDRNIIGDLFINGEFFCYTLEDEKRADGVKVKHQTAISPGVYKVVVTMSNRFKRLMPLLLKVPMFEGIRIHGGNTSKNTSGCILVAKNTDYKKIWRTQERAITAKIIEAINHGQKVTIEIIDAPLSYDRKMKTVR